MINISPETNKDLYLDIDNCVEYCLSIKEVVPEKRTDFHVFWNVGLPFERKQALVLKSYLATQNLEKTRMTLWSNVDLSSNELVRPLLKYIDFKVYYVKQEIKGTELDGRNDVINATDDKNYLQGDLFKVLVPHKYGGVCVDSDCVLLRDFSPLLEQEFMYTWSYMTDKINGAVLHLFKDSQLGQTLLSSIGKIKARANSTCWNCDAYVMARNLYKDWTVFPCAFFNPEWQYKISDYQRVSNDEESVALRDHILRPFAKSKYSNKLYDGTFNWHWHNQWKANIEPGSKWQILEEKTHRLLDERLDNWR